MREVFVHRKLVWTLQEFALFRFDQTTGYANKTFGNNLDTRIKKCQYWVTTFVIRHYEKNFKFPKIFKVEKNFQSSEKIFKVRKKIFKVRKNSKSEKIFKVRKNSKSEKISLEKFSKFQKISMEKLSKFQKILSPRKKFFELEKISKSENMAVSEKNSKCFAKKS